MNNIIQVDYVKDDISDFFLDKLEYLKSDKKFYQKVRNMKGEYFGSVNLLPSADNEFYTYLDMIKKKAEGVISRLLTHHYTHMLDYTKGGHLKQHNHKHAEDYTSILYLNDTDDGSTFFIINDKRYEILPEKNKLIMYPSEIEHGSNYSRSKKVLVSGYRYD